MTEGVNCRAATLGNGLFVSERAERYEPPEGTVSWDKYGRETKVKVGNGNFKRNNRNKTSKKINFKKIKKKNHFPVSLIIKLSV